MARVLAFQLYKTTFWTRYDSYSKTDVDEGKHTYRRIADLRIIYHSPSVLSKTNYADWNNLSFVLILFSVFACPQGRFEIKWYKLQCCLQVQDADTHQTFDNPNIVYEENIKLEKSETLTSNHPRVGDSPQEGKVLSDIVDRLKEINKQRGKHSKRGSFFVYVTKSCERLNKIKWLSC